MKSIRRNKKEDKIDVHKKTEIKYLNYEKSFKFENGVSINELTIAYTTNGHLNVHMDNAILICHAFTGDSDVISWWSNFVGKKKAIDTDKYFVICSNVLGGCSGTTGPSSKKPNSNLYYGTDFPTFTIKDIVKVQKILIDYLGINKLYCVVGGSMGGMQTLCFAILYPRIAKMFIPIATSYASNPNIIAINKVMKEVIMLDPAFNGGNYEINGDYRFKGLQIARMLGFTQYISLDTMQNKFSRKYVLDDGHFDMFGRFEIERYLDYNGATFASLFASFSVVPVALK